MRPEQRPVVLGEPLERLEGQVEAVEARVLALELGHDAQAVGVMIEATPLAHGAIERPLAGMAERRMAEVVRERQRLGEILVQPEQASHAHARSAPPRGNG